MKSIFPILLVTTLFLWNACTNDQAALPGPCGIVGEVSFSQDVQPILATYCYFPGTNQPCHVSDSPDGNYTSYEGVAAKAALIRNRAVIQRDMPPEYSTEGPIEIADPCDVTLIQMWIDEGAKNN